LKRPQRRKGRKSGFLDNGSRRLVRCPWTKRPFGKRAEERSPFSQAALGGVKHGQRVEKTAPQNPKKAPANEAPSRSDAWKRRRSENGGPDNGGERGPPRTVPFQRGPRRRRPSRRRFSELTNAPLTATRDGDSRRRLGRFRGPRSLETASRKRHLEKGPSSKAPLPKRLFQGASSKAPRGRLRLEGPVSGPLDTAPKRRPLFDGASKEAAL